MFANVRPPIHLRVDLYFYIKSTSNFRVHLDRINTALWRSNQTEFSVFYARNFFTLKNAEFTIRYSNLCCNYIIS